MGVSGWGPFRIIHMSGFMVYGLRVVVNDISRFRVGGHILDHLPKFISYLLKRPI